MSDEVYKKALETGRQELKELHTQEQGQEERLKAVKLRREQLRVLVENLAIFLGDTK